MTAAISDARHRRGTAVRLDVLLPHYWQPTDTVQGFTTSAASMGVPFNLDSQGVPVAIEFDSIQSSAAAVPTSHQQEFWVQAVSK